MQKLTLRQDVRYDAVVQPLETEVVKTEYVWHSRHDASWMKPQKGGVRLPVAMQGGNSLLGPDVYDMMGNQHYLMK